MALRQLAKEGTTWQSGACLLAAKTYGQEIFSAAEIGPLTKFVLAGVRGGRHHR
jgi:hypothetical protein